MSIGTTVPSGRNNTLTPDDIHRKSFEEKLTTVFNKDQLSVLLPLVAEAEESSAIASLLETLTGIQETLESLAETVEGNGTAIGALQTSVSNLSDSYTALEARVAALEPDPEPDPEPVTEGGE